MKKLLTLFLVAGTPFLSAITSTMTHRTMGTSPLLYKMINYAKRQWSFEAEPIYSSLWNENQVISNIILGGKETLIFDQQGTGDLNPVWLNLMANTTTANYRSQVTFTPSLWQSGMLLHWYDQFDKVFVDVKTALVQCKSQVAITEIGGNNGLNEGVVNAQQAFTQASWDYGKIGQANHVTGLDNIEIRIGGVTQATSNASTYDLFITGFGIIEAPTGTGTKAEWLFEPQVGTNHWGVGLGFEALMCGDDDLRFMIAGNYRYLTPAWEMRSFDLTNNGPWSRYLGVQNIYGLPTAPATLALPGINYFTQQAYINGRSELNLYARLAKEFRSSYFEVSYNFFCREGENIRTIKNVTPGYGIYALTGPAVGAGGVATASRATINQDVTSLDPIGAPVEITSDSFNKFSACAGTYASNMLAARLEISNNNMVYGFGAAIESGLSKNAISTWSVWAKFEYLFDNIQYNYDDEDYYTPLYDYDQTTHTIEPHTPSLDEEFIEALQAKFLEDLYTHNFEVEIQEPAVIIEDEEPSSEESLNWDETELEFIAQTNEEHGTINLDHEIEEEKQKYHQELIQYIKEEHDMGTIELDDEDIHESTQLAQGVLPLPKPTALTQTTHPASNPIISQTELHQEQRNGTMSTENTLPELKKEEGLLLQNSSTPYALHDDVVKIQNLYSTEQEILQILSNK